MYNHNIPFIVQAMSDWDMIKATPTTHPLRLHFIRREFSALEGIISNTAGKSTVGDALTLADCFIVPQIRNSLLGGIDLPNEFPVMNEVFKNLLKTTCVAKVVNDAGGTIQPLAFDVEKFESIKVKLKLKLIEKIIQCSHSKAKIFDNRSVMFINLNIYYSVHTILPKARRVLSGSDATASRCINRKCPIAFENS